MIPVQPVCLWKYLHRQPTQLPNDLESHFYLSWEDGLWDIFASYGLPQGAKIMIPTFFCVDVIENMRTHGLDPIYYPVDENLQPDPRQLVKQIKQIKPSILVLFHAVGIQNICINKTFINKLNKNIIVIEDCVHRIVNPSILKIYRDNHFCITSLRKVVPLQGSFLYGKKDAVNILNGADSTTHIYSWSVIVLWWIMQICLLFQKYVPIQSTKKYYGYLAEYVMKKGYDLIGDSARPGYAPDFFKKKYDFLDHKKISDIKKEQANLYSKKLAEAPTRNKECTIPTITNSDKGSLRGFPIIINGNKRHNIITRLRKKGILVRSELEGCPWVEKRSIIYLPMGPYVDKKDIVRLCDMFMQTVSTVT